MKEKIQKYVSLICIVLFAMWLGHDLSYEPLIGLICSFTAFIWDDTKQIIKSTSRNIFIHDQKIYNEIIQAFEDKNIISFLKQINFHSSFKSEYGYNIIFITEFYEPPEYEFWDTKIEKYRKDLFSSLNKLAHRISLWTYPSHMDRHTAIPDNYRSAFDDLPEEIENRINEMHKLTSEVINKYSVFYKEAGKKYEQAVQPLLPADARTSHG